MPLIPQHQQDHQLDVFRADPGDLPGETRSIAAVAEEALG